MMLRAIVLALLLTLSGSALAADQATAPLSVVAGQVRQTIPVVITGAPYSAACNGTTDDVSAFNAASAAIGAAGGGTILVPNTGSPCRIGSDILLRPNVTLRFEPGATLKATASSSFTFGMVTTVQVTPVLQVSADNVRVDGGTFDLNARLGPALYLNGAGAQIIRSTVTNGDTSEAADHNLTRLACTGGQCTFRDNAISCASTSGAKDVGLFSSGSSPTAISGNRITGCDSVGVSVNGLATVSTNIVSETGASGVTVLAANGSTVQIRGNDLTASGSSGRGVSLGSTTSLPDVSGNRIVVSGASGVAIENLTINATITSNRWSLTSNTAGAGNDTAKGYTSTSAYGQATITGNVGTVSTTDAQTHIDVGGTQTAVVGNVLIGGAYCVAPSLNSGTINVNVVGNRCYSQGTVAIVTVTGWIVNGNYLAWLGAGARTAILIGDDRGTQKFAVDHVNVTGNIISSFQTGVGGIETAVVNKTCDGGSKVNQNCTTDDQDNTTGCPGTSGSGHCDAQTFEGVQVVSNHFIYGTSGSEPVIDLSPGVTSTSGDTWDWVINGNTFDLNATTGVAMNFPSSNQTKVRGIEIGPNSFVGAARLQNWTPDMGFDYASQSIYKRAAVCANESTPIITSLFELVGSSSWPTRACRPGSGAYRWGALSFPDAADKEAMTSEVLPGPTTATYKLKARIIFACSSANTQVVRWIVRGRCVSLLDAYDSAWCGESGTCAVSESASCTNADANGLVASSWLDVPTDDTGCFGGDTLQVLVSRDGNGTTGTDSHTNDAHMQGVQLYVTRQKTSN